MGTTLDKILIVPFGFVPIVLFAINLLTNRYGRGKIARKVGYPRYDLFVSVYCPFIFCASISIALTPTSHTSRDLIGVVLVLPFEVLVIDDFLNGGPPRRKKRFRSWAKNKLAKLKSLMPDRSKPKTLPQPS